uniref:Uncharacterized protein n=1 Tax=Aegilops tauschii subsp. strangulata TaxID=200361 RepID=A0A453IC53_AEGTS
GRATPRHLHRVRVQVRPAGRPHPSMEHHPNRRVESTFTAAQARTNDFARFPLPRVTTDARLHFPSRPVAVYKDPPLATSCSPSPPHRRQEFELPPN